MTNNDNKLLFVAICLASFLGCLDLTIVNTAVPMIQQSYSVTISTLQWVMSGLLLAVASSMVLVGRLADTLGQRKLLLIGLWLFGVSSLGAGLAPFISLLIGARIVQGVAIAILYTAPVAIINNNFDPHKIPKMMGVYFGISTIGIAAGPILGGLIINLLSWRWIFLLNIPIIVFSLIVCGYYLTDQSELKEGTIDWLGAVMLMLGLVCLVFSITHPTYWYWFIVAAIVFLGLGAYEACVDDPIITWQVMGNKAFIVGCLANIALAFYYSVAFFLMPLYLHIVKGFNDLKIGLTLLPATLTLGILSPIISGLLNRVATQIILIVGFLVFSLCGLLQASFTSSTPMYELLLAYVLLGVGWACILNPSITAAVTSVKKQDSGVAMGMIGTFHNIGGAVGLAIGSFMFTYFSKDQLRHLLHMHADKAWIRQAVSDPEKLIQVLKQHTHLAASKVQAISAQTFMHGQTAAMILISGVSVVVLVVLLATLGRRPNAS